MVYENAITIDQNTSQVQGLPDGYRAVKMALDPEENTQYVIAFPLAHDSDKLLLYAGKGGNELRQTDALISQYRDGGTIKAVITTAHGYMLLEFPAPDRQESPRIGDLTIASPRDITDLMI